MTREEIDKLWQKALRESVHKGELFTRYAFADLVIANEREACAKVCSQSAHEPSSLWSEPGCWTHSAQVCAEKIMDRGNP